MKAIALVGAQWGLDAARLAGVPAYDHGYHANEPMWVFFLNWSAFWDVREFTRWNHVNFHCSALPYGRGGNPIENLILNGHGQTVITAHQMTNDVDAGPIYGTSGPVSLLGTKADITARFVEPVAKMMRWIIDTNPEPTPQVGEPTYFKRLPPDQYREFWAKRGAWPTS